MNGQRIASGSCDLVRELMLSSFFASPIQMSDSPGRLIHEGFKDLPAITFLRLLLYRIPRTGSPARGSTDHDASGSSCVRMHGWGEQQGKEDLSLRAYAWMGRATRPGSGLAMYMTFQSITRPRKLISPPLHFIVIARSPHPIANKSR
jgi:hypothetical protein